MKNKIIIYFIILIVLVMVSSCKEDDDESVSIEERISMFMDDINSLDRSSVYKNIHPDADQYDACKPDTYWNTRFQTSAISYSLSSTSKSGGTYTATINSTGAWGYDGRTAVFAMLEDDEDVWKIKEITIDGDIIID